MTVSVSQPLPPFFCPGSPVLSVKLSEWQSDGLKVPASNPSWGRLATTDDVSCATLAEASIWLASMVLWIKLPPHAWQVRWSYPGLHEKAAENFHAYKGVNAEKSSHFQLSGGVHIHEARFSVSDPELRWYLYRRFLNELCRVFV